MLAQLDIALLRPSTISGLFKLRRHLSERPREDAARLVHTLRATYANAGLDFDGALALHGSLPPTSDNPEEAMRQVITHFVTVCRPAWTAHVTHGRQALRRSLAIDLLTCFERTGALDAAPTPAALSWFDGLVAAAFSDDEKRRLAIGREAERRSFELERSKVSEFTSPRTVKWVALDDSGAGFDIESAALEDERVVPQFIEVKSSSRSPAQIYLTRNEWEAARRLSHRYFLHIWTSADDLPRVVAYSELADHIPADSGDGRWDTVRITFP